MKHAPFVCLIDVSTRSKRRKALSIAIDLLEKIRIAEEAYFDRIPINFHSGDAYAATECSIDILIDAISTLLSVYD